MVPKEAVVAARTAAATRVRTAKVRTGERQTRATKAEARTNLEYCNIHSRMRCAYCEHNTIDQEMLHDAPLRRDDFGKM